MKILLSVLLFCSVLLTLVANPAPASLEVVDVGVLLSVLGLAALSLLTVRRRKLYPVERNLMLAVILYLGYLLMSAWLGVMSGVPILGVLRSVGPYISFFPLISVGLLSADHMHPRFIPIVLIAVGTLQIAYLGFLYFSHPALSATTIGVLQNRITFLDQRTTLPLMLAVPILPLIFMPEKSSAGFSRSVANIAIVALILLGLFASIITLTRAIFLAVIVGWVAFFAVYIYQCARCKTFMFKSFFYRVFCWLLLMILLAGMLSMLPKIQLLEHGLWARFSSHGAQVTDYSNGRISTEWMPALLTWVRSGWFSIIFGIGAGHPFSVLTGEERTYVHNLSIYTLVYGGVYGFISTLFLYLTLFKTLAVRAVQTQDSVYAAIFGLLASMFFYGQLFAVHKGLAFNVMLFLIMALALMRPSNYSQE